ncbi:MAG: hypothetical protein ACWGSD_06825, partial [Thermodesulfobacteriota bacterium]
MNLQALGRRILDSPIRRPLLGAGNRLLFRDGLRRALFSIVDSQLQEAVRPKKDVPKSTTRIERERVLVARAVLATVDRMIGRRQISPRLMRVVTELWGRAWSLSAREEPNSRRFLEVLGHVSPDVACACKRRSSPRSLPPSSRSLPVWASSMRCGKGPSPRPRAWA